MAGNYAFTPCPPRIGRFPIHPHLFMHSFLHPGDHMDSVALLRLPKKLRGELRQGSDAEEAQPVGWGVYIIEGYCWSLVRQLGVVAIVLLLLLAVLWCVLLGDVQSGMGVGQCAVGFLATLFWLLVLGREDDTVCVLD